MARPITEKPGWKKKMQPADVPLACQMIRNGLSVGACGKLPSSVQDAVRAKFGLTHAEFTKFRRDQGFVWVAPVKIKGLTHSQLMAQILEWLLLVDVVATPTDAGAVKGHGGRFRTHPVKKGWPDISGTLGGLYRSPGRSVYIEIKVDRDEPKPDQIKIANNLEKASALVIREARSIEQVKEVLEKEMKP